MQEPGYVFFERERAIRPHCVHGGGRTVTEPRLVDGRLAKEPERRGEIRKRRVMLDNVPVVHPTRGDGGRKG
jgi:hypothetical protein